MAPAWIEAGYWFHMVAALANALLAAWLLREGRAAGAQQRMLIVALGLAALWALVVAVMGPDALEAKIAESLRNFGFLCFMFALLRGSGVRQSAVTIPVIYAALVFVLVLQVAIDIVSTGFDAGSTGGSGAAQLVFVFDTIMRMIFAVGSLVLVHNLYVSAAPAARWGIRLPMTALAALWAYDLNLYTVAYLAEGHSPELKAMQGFVSALTVPFFALAVRRNHDWKVQLSRTAAFQSISLFAIGGYMMVMVLLAQLLRMVGGDYARLAQVSVVFAMSVAAIILLPSGKFRAWFKVKVSKHLFQHRYDYRAEWMRFTDTIGRPGVDAAPFHERVIQAVSDITDSPAGLLLTPDETGMLQLQARWNWATADVPAQAGNSVTAAWFESSGHIAELDLLRSGFDRGCNIDAVPTWILDEGEAWAIVPLVHFDRLAGLVVLSRPLIARTLDWEDFDMLRVVGRQVASYLAEEKSQEALLEAHRFDEFNRRFAFVMHDIKNLVSQLSLISRNAEKHADNPDFRADMVATLRNSVDKMNALLARLSQYDRKAHEETEAVAARPLVQALIAERRAQHDIKAFELAELTLEANADALQQVLNHLLQNAIEASQPHEPILVKLYADGLYACIEVQDNGCGMNAEFVRSKLFKPFVSSKSGGFGIGAFEARELVQAMGGRLEVESRTGIGSRFTVRLPLRRTDPAIATPQQERA